ncbi:hypothetical protein E8E15_002273 [Penicillium rubens]|uniref:HMG box domain-containing protein n=1 Tax=Penicillium chrysogenum TaxID=5076 RepID=A0ABQ8WD05_PENCH|nr:hypothetical protein E8E15_002273 [Penicillium rubens]KAJ5264526.1 hypothetical protein N7505_007319 [Penicillium chrysogenum]
MVSTKRAVRKISLSIPQHRLPRTPQKTTEFRLSTQKRHTLWWEDISSNAALPLNIPLSQSTRHMTNIPVEDMAKWVHRPLGDRKREEKAYGKVLRPRNCFILYKSAYARRIESALRKKDHSAVSAIAGRSWNMETPEVRQKFKVLAHIERQGHAEAHPEYRFTPLKRRRSQVTKDSSPDIEIPSPSVSTDQGPQPQDTTNTLLTSEATWWLQSGSFWVSAQEEFVFDCSSDLFELHST